MNPWVHFGLLIVLVVSSATISWIFCKYVMVVRYCRDEVWRQPPNTLLLQWGVKYPVVVGPNEPELFVMLNNHNQLAKLYRGRKP